MAKYISNKKIKNSKANEVDDFESIGKVAWKFISAFYESRWDSLITNKNNTPFRSKVLAKFTSKINEVNINKNKSSKSTDLSATFNKLSPPILAKLPREVNKISKYFKKNNQSSKKKEFKKSYAQASTSTNTTREVLKIKKLFLIYRQKKLKISKK